jgi:hypothetical protein
MRAPGHYANEAYKSRTMLSNTQTIATRKPTRIHCVFHQRMSDRTAHVSFNCSTSSTVRATNSKSAGVRFRATMKVLAPRLERQQHELDRQVTRKGRVIPEDRAHHERDEEERNVRLEIARPDCFGVSGDQTAVGLGGVGEGFVHLTLDRSLCPSARSLKLFYLRAKFHPLKALCLACRPRP